MGAVADLGLEALEPSQLSTQDEVLEPARRRRAPAQGALPDARRLLDQLLALGKPPLGEREHRLRSCGRPQLRGLAQLLRHARKRRRAPPRGRRGPRAPRRPSTRARSRRRAAPDPRFSPPGRRSPRPRPAAALRCPGRAPPPPRRRAHTPSPPDPRVGARSVRPPHTTARDARGRARRAARRPGAIAAGPATAVSLAQGGQRVLEQRNELVVAGRAVPHEPSSIADRRSGRAARAAAADRASSAARRKLALAPGPSPARPCASARARSSSQRVRSVAAPSGRERLERHAIQADSLLVSRTA